MAKKPGKTPQAIRDRAAKTATVIGRRPPRPPPRKGPAAKSLANPPRFFREVRAEARKITWTSRQETWITSVMVCIMVVLATVFFAVVTPAVQLGHHGHFEPRDRRVTRDVRSRHRRRPQGQPAPQVVHRPRLLELREEGGREHPRAGQAPGPGGKVLRNPGADRGGRRDPPRPQGQLRAQVLPRLRAGEDGADRRGLPPDQEHPEGDRLPGLRRPSRSRSPKRKSSASSAPSKKASSGRSRPSPSRSARRCGSPMVRSPASTARSNRSTKNTPACGSRSRSSAAPRRSSWNTARSKRSAKARRAVPAAILAA